ncbi:AAA family ATPase [Piscinibacter sp. XHJ-5]|uniref:ATP-binding protein n=1 Tax=Piscinibacter sp. XHJ-5 TaxID=3037797 RepID=UPI002452AC66|nr:AAA family ATPase [Piscinibacter sp. XHJ-5]
MNIEAWLHELGLARYAREFEANDIDQETLHSLTAADLVGLGVTSVGHRRKLMVAIAELKARVLPHGGVAQPVQASAERRQLSVLYCDMVGSTALSDRLDAEDMREVVRAFHAACTRMVPQYDGYVANFIGDSVLAYFGWPRAHEDDAERAVRCAWAMARAVAALRTPGGEALAARVGIATSAVVVGDLVRQGPAREHSAVGVAPDLAAQLQALAAPGRVVIDEITKQLLSASFAVHGLGRHALRGIEQPVQAYSVGEERPSESRFEARRGPQLAPMVGREQELALLLECWKQTRGGEGQVVLLVGEAGIGKSRLTRALLDAVATQPHEAVCWQCSPYHTGSPLWPVIQRLSRTARLREQDSTEQALDKLETTAGGAQAAALYATLLGLNGTQRYGPLELTPQMLRERTLELMVEQLQEIAQPQGLLLVLEDAHWIDPTTLELIERCLECIDSVRMFILVTSRPDNEPQLAAHPAVTRLTLNRLSRMDVEAIVAKMGGEALQAHTRATIVAQTDGVPLFAEELTKAVLETGEASIPASLHGSLMARLDRIPEVKAVAQVAACIGREFDAALLQEVVEQPDNVQLALDKLIDAELIFRRGTRTHGHYTFKHALVQEAVYESLLRGRRQAIHARIIEVLEALHADGPSEILAHHAERARQSGKAISYWSQAGDSALAKSAYVEAAGYCSRAIDLIGREADCVDRRRQELQLQLTLAKAHRASGGPGAKETRAAYERAYALLDAAPDDLSHRFATLDGLWAANNTGAEFKKALMLATEAVTNAVSAGSHEMLMCAHRSVAVSHTFLGDFERAAHHFEQALGLARLPKQAGFTAQLAVDPGPACLSGLGLVKVIQGHAEQAATLIQQARGVGSGLTQAYTHFYGALLAICTRDIAATAVELEAMEGLANRHRLPFYKGLAHCLRGCWIMASCRPAAQAVDAYERGIREIKAVGSPAFVPFFMAGMGSALAADGRHEQAVSAVELAIAMCADSAQGWCDAELWRVRGDVLSKGPRRDDAQIERCFERAMTIAHSRGARLWELRAAVSQARLMGTQSERRRALDLLAPVYGRFTEGLTTVDLVEARSLLVELEHQCSA